MLIYVIVFCITRNQSSFKRSEQSNAVIQQQNEPFQAEL